MRTARSSSSGGADLPNPPGGRPETDPPGGLPNPLDADPPPPGADPYRQTPPPVNRHRCKNITLPQTSFAGGNYLWNVALEADIGIFWLRCDVDRKVLIL